MKKDCLNLIIRNNVDVDGITEAIINEFRKYYKKVSGIVINCNSEKNQKDNLFEYIPWEIVGSHDSEYLFEPDTPIDGDVLDAMKEYKSMAMHIMMRTLHYDVYDRKYLENIYFKHLKYWNAVLKNKNINMAIFMVTPHHVGEYILYSLCQIYNINTIIMYPQLSYHGSGWFIGKSIETIGANIGDRYKKYKDTDYVDTTLSDFLQGNVNNTLQNKVVGYGNRKKIASNAKKNIYALIKMKRLMLLSVAYVKNYFNKNRRSRLRNEIKYIVRARKYERKMDHLKEYNKHAKQPVDGEKYIYFPLQMTPEASTMPLAGEFNNQLLSIELLASAAKEYNLKVYVKEHWVQYNRDTDFYKRISEISNVRLISLEYNSLDLLEKSVMVATQTGNVLYEALVKGKPAISIGRGCTYKDAPNIFVVQNRDDISNSIKQVLDDNFKITQEDIEMYLKAIDDCIIFSYLDSIDESYKEYDKEKTARQIIEFAEDYCD
ncbi:MAG: hypothetical protein J6P79_10210 [Pseudobutyrivibrio sp.]|nr:hypothetical protein [Pseudobutyrivibrio sp.]